MIHQSCRQHPPLLLRIYGGLWGFLGACSSFLCLREDIDTLEQSRAVTSVTQNAEMSEIQLPSYRVEDFLYQHRNCSRRVGKLGARKLFIQVFSEASSSWRFPFRRKPQTTL